MSKLYNAARIFRQLVNENYNPIINAQLLSSYYVSAFLAGENYAKEAYKANAALITKTEEDAFRKMRIYLSCLKTKDAILILDYSRRCRECG